MNKNNTMLLVIVGALIAAYYFITKQKAVTAMPIKRYSPAQSTGTARTPQVQSGQSGTRTSNALGIAQTAIQAAQGASGILSQFLGKGPGSASGGSGPGAQQVGLTPRSAPTANVTNSGPTPADQTQSSDAGSGLTPEQMAAQDAQAWQDQQDASQTDNTTVDQQSASDFSGADGWDIGGGNDLVDTTDASFYGD